MRSQLTETHRFPTDSVIGQFSSAVLRGDSGAAAHVLDKAWRLGIEHVGD